jgi:hypothetical protein
MLCPLRNAPLEIAQAYASQYQAKPIARIEDSAVEGATPRARASCSGKGGNRASSAHPFGMQRTVPGLRAGEPSARDTDRNLSVSWFVSAGVLETEDILDLQGSNVARLRAPDEPGSVHVWVNVRDDRGGVRQRMQRLQIVR